MTRRGPLGAAVGSMLLVLSCTCPDSVHAFGAGLTRPWERESTLVQSSMNNKHLPSLLFLLWRPGNSLYPSTTTSTSISHALPYAKSRTVTAIRTKRNDDDNEEDSPGTPAFEAGAFLGKQDAGEASDVGLSKHTSGASRSGHSKHTPISTDTVWSNIGPLFQMVRPANFPVIVLFHMLGVYLALSGQGPSSNNLYWSILLREPTMWLVLAAILLTSSTSMVVNDYYDAKLGRDMLLNVNGSDDVVLAQGRVSFEVARRFLSYLYGASLVIMACLPGVPTRLAVVGGLVLTFFYTQSLKPMTWVKNLVCASLVALSPLTSGLAALHVVHQHANSLNNINMWAATGIVLPRLLRLTATIFFGILGREIMMDCNDVEDDRRSQVMTVPVVHGLRCASAVSLATSIVVSGLTVGLELLEIGTTVHHSISRKAARRLALSGIASAMTLRRSWQVYRTHGSDPKTVDKAINESLVAVAILLASFV